MALRTNRPTPSGVAASPTILNANHLRAVTSVRHDGRVRFGRAARQPDRRGARNAAAHADPLLQPQPFAVLARLDNHFSPRPGARRSPSAIDSGWRHDDRSRREHDGTNAGKRPGQSHAQTPGRRSDNAEQQQRSGVRVDPAFRPVLGSGSVEFGNRRFGRPRALESRDAQASHRGLGEPLPLDIDDRDVVLAAGVVRRIDERADDLVRMPRPLARRPDRSSTDATVSVSPSLQSSSAASGSNGTCSMSMKSASVVSCGSAPTSR